MLPRAFLVATLPSTMAAMAAISVGENGASALTLALMRIWGNDE